MSVLRTASIWIVAFLMAVFMTALFATIAAMQLTAEDTGARMLRRAVLVSTELDESLPAIEAELRTAASQTEEDPVRVPGFPIPVYIPKEEAAALEGDALRNEILGQSAALLYENGMSVWVSDDPDASQALERLSAAGAMDEGLGLVRDETHTVFLILTVLLGIIVLGMAAILLIVLPWDARLLVLGAVTLAAALPSLAAAVALRFAFRMLEEGDDPFVNALARLGADAMWVPIRNSLTLTLLGMVVLLLGTLVVWYESRRQPPDSRIADSQL